MLKKLSISLILVVFLLSCKSDDSNERIPPIIENPDPENPEDIELAEEVEVYVAEQLENGFVLTMANGGNTAVLLNKQGFVVHQWNFDSPLGNDFEIMPNGQLLGMFRIENPFFSFGGYGGKIRLMNQDTTVDWEFDYNSPEYIAHHDVEMLPNGNILFIAWEKLDSQEALQFGIEVNNTIYPETLIEVNPSTNEIEWEWHSKDHMIQNTNSNLPNFGVISDNPQLINPHYNNFEHGNIMHANGIDYDPEKDVIFVSVNFYSEIWVIDHSTTTAEATSHSGGNYNKGGDLIYRFGNPTAYQNPQGERLFYNNHFPNFLEENEIGHGNILMYMNGNFSEQSIVYEFQMPENYNLQPNIDNEPQIVWEFTHPDLFYDRISGAVRLPNGNTLICEGDFGLWEVTPQKQIVWKYHKNQNFWRGYSYLPTDTALQFIDLD